MYVLICTVNVILTLTSEDIKRHDAVNVNSKVMICTVSSAHWQQDSKLAALRRFELIFWGKPIEINAPMNIVIIMILFQS